ncbi:MAG TPA: DUF4111 domain-containing protein [Candidatus Eisenbergiella pullicola]|nr:DUF4111 domain-containing protein [Candidatus Eisenbergiella pullicola]
MNNGPLGWENCGETIRTFAEGLIALLRRQLGEDLKGVYLHGSLAMGCFYFPKSDLDLIGVSSRRLCQEEAESLNRAIADRAAGMPGEGGLEFSLVLEETALRPSARPEYLIHYSGFWRERILRGEVNYREPLYDGDLTAHFWAIRQRGVCLYGAPIGEAFGEVDFSDLRTSLEGDYRWILKGQLFANPCYGILNLCRALELFGAAEKKCRSKEEGGLWGLAHLPEPFRKLIRKALEEYRGKGSAAAGVRRAGRDPAGWDFSALTAFADFAARELERADGEKGEDRK